MGEGKEKEVKRLEGVHVAFDCPFCGARMSHKNLDKVVCPRCGAKGVLQATANLVIEHEPTKKPDENGYYR